MSIRETVAVEPFLAMGMALLLTLGIASEAPGFTKQEEACIKTLNKNLQKVSAAHGKVLCKCLKDFAKGKTNHIPLCVALNDGKVSKAAAKALDAEASKCSTPPSVLVTSAANNNLVAADKELAVRELLFGSDVNATVITEATDKNASKCQLKVSKSLKKCQDTKFKEFNKCKKGAIAGATSPSAAVTAVEACVTSLATNAKVSKACAKVKANIDKKCVAKGVTLSTAFPECDATSSATVALCLEYGVECAVCLALNAADGLAVDCDLFDDGMANGSCGGGPPPAPCSATSPPMCDGDCPPGEICSDVGGSCACVAPPAPCSATSPPMCDGDCPPGEVCTDTGTSCVCLPPPPAACGDSFPMCDGACMPGESCVDDGAGSCVCLPPSAPCMCGASCPFDCGPFGGPVMGFCVIASGSLPPGDCHCTALCPGLPPKCPPAPPGVCTMDPCTVSCPGGGSVAGICEFPDPDGCLCGNLGTLPCP
ncbi:MAG: hypothetical protein ACE5FG_13515 [Myxococcota bacterium]